LQFIFGWSRHRFQDRRRELRIAICSVRHSLAVQDSSGANSVPM